MSLPIKSTQITASMGSNSTILSTLWNYWASWSKMTPIARTQILSKSSLFPSLNTEISLPLGSEISGLILIFTLIRGNIAALDRLSIFQSLWLR